MDATTNIVKDPKWLVQCLNAGYNLARWLLRDAAEAEDAVQDACVSALRHIDDVREETAPAWFLKIVRNGCYDRLRRRPVDARAVFDERRHLGWAVPNQEAALLTQEEAGRLHAEMLRLPSHLREVLVLRELEEMTYAEIAAVLEISKGTVMSRLSRARTRLLAVSGPAVA